ncbi:hypothetical protein O6H91_03G039400 [Diphasiastrum complanatum]|uniref:Uncharacterized protein n=1 Tax=Diphasiastrum complanatum TaxID=34168 RepID=A0ACC2E5R3_DIPCM|nr:hypothetical protein O6H91_03G039400 [Diphasiastrum complanatum]
MATGGAMKRLWLLRNGPRSCLIPSFSNNLQQTLSNMLLLPQPACRNVVSDAGSAAASNDRPINSSGERSNKKDSSSSHGAERTYGEVQRTPGRVAEEAYKSHESSSSSQDSETLESTGFDMSKRTRPSGEE